MNWKRLLFFSAFTWSVLLSFSQLDSVRVNVGSGISDPQLLKTIEMNASHLMSSLNSTIMAGKTRLKLNGDAFTEEGLECIIEMWKSSAMMCPVSSVIENCQYIGEGRGLQIRNIPVVMLAADEDAQDQELVINFTPSGKIDNVLVALEQHRYRNILHNPKTVKDLVCRQTIVDFVENFRTAYNRKDIDYINSVFSNDALIITGKVIKVVENTDHMMQSLSKEQVHYQTSTKEEYIKNLKRCFSRNSYINLKFEELEVLRHPMYEHIYGVTLKQHWHSSNYSDIGYLFLMIDFTDPSLPCIQVRTWQPYKYGGKTISRDEVFEVTDFNI